MIANFRDIIKLIKVLRENGVQKFEGFGFQIVLGSETNANPITPTVRQTRASAKKAEQIERDSLIDENIEVSEEQLSLALIEDPARFEQLLREGELEDAERSQYRGPESAVQ